MQQERTHKYNDTEYDLEIGLENYTLIFTLRTQGKFLFKNSFTYDQLPEEIKNNFPSIFKLYRYLGKRKNFNVNEKAGTISLHVKKLVQNEVQQIQQILKLKQIGSNLSNKPYQMLVAEVESLKMDMMGMKAVIKMNNLSLDPQIHLQDKEQFSRQIFDESDKLIKLLKQQRKKDIQLSYQDLMKVKAMEANYNEEISQLKSSLKAKDTEIAQIKKKLKDVQNFNNKRQIQLLDRIHELVNQVGNRDPNPEKVVLKPKNLFAPVPTEFTKLFVFENQEITYVGKKNNWTQLILSNEEIPEKYQFHCQVINSLSCNITVGVVAEYKQFTVQRFSYNSGHAICYSGYDGSLHYGNKHEEYISKEQGKGFQLNDVITVDIDRKKGNAKFLANGKIIASISSGLLKNRERKFLPFIEMFDKGDVVKVWQ